MTGLLDLILFLCVIIAYIIYELTLGGKYD